MNELAKKIFKLIGIPVLGTIVSLGQNLRVLGKNSDLKRSWQIIRLV